VRAGPKWGKLYKATLTLIRPVDYCVFRNFNCLAHLGDRGTASPVKITRLFHRDCPLLSITIGYLPFSIPDILPFWTQLDFTPACHLPFTLPPSAAPHLPRLPRLPPAPAPSGQLRNMKDCPTCKGNGTTKCDACNGKGCPSCKRSGSNKCSVCEGTGAIHAEH
jgi:hypothetical protein